MDNALNSFGLAANAENTVINGRHNILFKLHVDLADCYDS